MDITPLDMDEVEKFCFEHKRVFFPDLAKDLQQDLEDLLGEVITRSYGDHEYALQRLPKLLNQFSCTTLKKYIQGTFCADAQAGYTVKSLNPWELDLWIDYYGITQAQVDKFPRDIKRQMMDKYLIGWRKITADKNNNESFARFMKQALAEEFSNKKADRYNEKEMESRAKYAILHTGIVHDVECKWSPYMNQLHIKMQMEGQPDSISFTATIQ